MGTSYTDSEVDAWKTADIHQYLVHHNLFDTDYEDDTKLNEMIEVIQNIIKNNPPEFFDKVEFAIRKFPIAAGEIQDWFAHQYEPILTELNGLKKLTELGICNLKTKDASLSQNEISALQAIIRQIVEDRNEIKSREGQGYIPSAGYQGGKNITGCKEGLNQMIKDMFARNPNWEYIKKKYFTKKNGYYVAQNYIVGSKINGENGFIKLIKDMCADKAVAFDSCITDVSDMDPNVTSLSAFFSLYLKDIADYGTHESEVENKRKELLKDLQDAFRLASNQLTQMQNMKDYRQQQKDAATARYQANQSNTLGDATLLMNICYPLVLANYIIQLFKKYNVPLNDLSVNDFMTELDDVVCTIYRREKFQIQNVSKDTIKGIFSETLTIGEGDDDLFTVPDELYNQLYQDLIVGPRNSLHMCPLIMRRNVMLRIFCQCRPLNLPESVLFRLDEGTNMFKLLGMMGDNESYKQDPKYNTEIYIVYQHVVSGFTKDDFFSVKNLVQDRDVWSRIQIDGVDIKY